DVFGFYGKPARPVCGMWANEDAAHHIIGVREELPLKQRLPWIDIRVPIAIENQRPVFVADPHLHANALYAWKTGREAHLDRWAAPCSGFIHHGGRKHLPPRHGHRLGAD